MSVNNRWNPAIRYELDVASLPVCLDMLSGVTAVPTLDSEVVLLLRDKSPSVERLAALRPFNFHNNSMLLKTPHGIVCVILDWISLPEDAASPYAVYERYLDIYNQGVMKDYYTLVNQEYLHLFILNSSNKVIDAFEFPNMYGPRDLEAIVRQVTAANPKTDLFAAVKYIQQQYSLNDLFAKGTQ